MENETYVPIICENCKYSAPYLSDNLNFCRRHAPQSGLTDSQPVMPPDAVWPLVKDDDWCGEFAPQEN